MPIPSESFGIPESMPAVPHFEIREREVAVGGRNYRHQHEMVLADGKVVKCFIASGEHRDINQIKSTALEHVGYVRLQVLDADSHPVDVLVKKKALLGLGLREGEIRDSQSATQAINNYQMKEQETTRHQIEFLKRDGVGEDALLDDLDPGGVHALYEGRKASRDMLVDFLIKDGVDEDVLQSLDSNQLQGFYEARMHRHIDQIISNSPPRSPVHSPFPEHELNELPLDELKHLSYSVRYQAGKLTADEIAAIPPGVRSSYLEDTVNTVPPVVVTDHVYYRDPEAMVKLLEPIVPSGFAASITVYQPLDSDQIAYDLGRSTCRVGGKEIQNNSHEAIQSVRDFVNIEGLSEEAKNYLSTFILDNLSETNIGAQIQGAAYEAYGMPGGAIMISPASQQEFWLPTEEREIPLDPTPKSVEMTNEGKIRITVTLSWDVNNAINPDDYDPEANEIHTYARITTASVIECTPDEIIRWRGDASQCTPKITITRVEPPSSTPVEDDLAAAA